MIARLWGRRWSWLEWVGDMPGLTTLLLDKPWLSPWCLPKIINVTFRSIGTVVFSNSPATGMLALAAMFVSNPQVAYSCLLACLIGIVFAKLLHQPEPLITEGVVVFNGILLGCVSVSVFPSLVGLPVEAKFYGVLAFFIVVTSFIDKGLNAMMLPTKLPALSLPFNFAGAFMFLSLRGALGLTGTQLPPTDIPPLNTTTTLPPLTGGEGEDQVDWAKVLEGSLLTVGQVYGVPTVQSSAMVLVAFCLYSPMLTCCFYVGGLIGTLAGILPSVPPYTDVYIGLWGYNALLTSGGLGYFLVPTPASLLAVVFGAALTAVIQAAMAPIFMLTSMPLLSFPFNAATLLILAISTTDNPPLIWVPVRSFPERHFINYFNRKTSGNTGPFPAAVTNSQEFKEAPPDPTLHNGGISTIL